MIFFQNGGDPVETFLANIQNSGVGDGVAFWSMFGHDDDCCQWVEHDDGESFYFQRSALYINQGNKIVRLNIFIRSSFVTFIFICLRRSLRITNLTQDQAVRRP